MCISRCDTREREYDDGIKCMKMCGFVCRREIGTVGYMYREEIVMQKPRIVLYQSPVVMEMTAGV
jgi:hypothetical protein